ncbi:MAG: hypothetical protein Q9173_006413 [Seirophora scorigena]
MDKIIHDANSEIDKLNQKVSNLQIDRDKLQSENTSLVNAFREKSRKHQQTQELYDRLKRKEMMNVTQSAAFGAVEEVLSNNVAGRPGQSRPTPNSFSTRPQEQHDAPRYQYGPGQDLGHQRAGSNGSGGSGGVMMPPPQRRPMVFGGHMLGTGNNNATPIQHRTQMGSQVHQISPQRATRLNPGFAAAPTHNPTPSRRIALGNMSASNLNRTGFGGYGMSAGLKVGRQEGHRSSVPQSNLGQTPAGLENHDRLTQFSRNTQRYR